MATKTKVRKPTATTGTKTKVKAKKVETASTALVPVEDKSTFALNVVTKLITLKKGTLNKFSKYFLVDSLLHNTFTSGIVHQLMGEFENKEVKYNTTSLYSFINNVMDYVVKSKTPTADNKVVSEYSVSMSLVDKSRCAITIAVIVQAA